MVASQVPLADRAPLPVYLLINKYDLVAPYRGEKRLLALNHEYLEEFCNKSCIDGWRYVSAKTGFKVKSALKDLVAHIINHDISQYSDPSDEIQRTVLSYRGRDYFSLEFQSDEKTKKCC